MGVLSGLGILLSGVLNFCLSIPFEGVYKYLLAALVSIHTVYMRGSATYRYFPKSIVMECTGAANAYRRVFPSLIIFDRLSSAPGLLGHGRHVSTGRFALYRQMPSAPSPEDRL
jgi:hypothetical protein